jgi:hypothetical protein
MLMLSACNDVDCICARCFTMNSLNCHLPGWAIGLLTPVEQPLTCALAGDADDRFPLMGNIVQAQLCQYFHALLAALINQLQIHPSISLCKHVLLNARVVSGMVRADLVGVFFALKLVGAIIPAQVNL